MSALRIGMPDVERWHAVYLSPHFDDAVFSCGGTIRRRCRAGQRVLVITVCGAIPPPAADLSPYAGQLHARWQASGRAAPAALDRGALDGGARDRRRDEDARALARLGAVAAPWEVADAIYRQDAHGRWPYASDEALFGRPYRGDARLARTLAERLRALPAVDRGTLVFAPMAVGRHVDHQLVRRAAELWRGRSGVLLYEDYPYAADVKAAGWPRGVAGGTARSWRPWLCRLEERDLQAKVTAAASYGSQTSTFWSDGQAMAAAVRAFAVRTGGGVAAERCWRQVGGRPSPRDVR